MIRRPFFALVGLGVGVTLGMWTARRLDQARQAMAPGQVAARAGAVNGRLAAALAEGRQAAALRESELRAAYGVSQTPAPSATHRQPGADVQTSAGS